MEANKDKTKAYWETASRKKGRQPFNENRNCAYFLGVHVAERVLSHVFKNVERMHIQNPGYDFICAHGKKIDVKSACLQKARERWSFNISHNITADYFLFLAFDNRKDLNPLHIWLIPGTTVNNLNSVSIRPTAIGKWAKYELDVLKVVSCCDVLRN